MVLNEFVQKYKEGKLSQVDFLTGINTLGGTRQKETLLALVENFDQVKKHMDDVTNATGSAKQMYDVYSQSLEARIADLKRAFEGLYEKILSSDSLKWLVTEFTQLITALSNVDGKTIAFTATIGGLILVMSKLATLNKTLLMGEVVTGLSKFIAVLTGMSSVKTTIDEVTNATKAMQVAQMGVIAQTEGLTGLKGAWVLLSGGIKEATASSVAFMASPLGLILTALTATLGLVVAGFVAYKQHQEELTQKSKELKTALDGVNEALKGGDVKSANNNLDKIKQEYEEYKRLANLKKEYEEKLKTAGNEKNIAGMYGVSETEQYTATIKNLDQQLEEHKKVLNDAGISEEKFAQLQSNINYQDQINTIKEMTKTQVDNRINVEANKEEYNNYIAKIQELYSEYQNLSAQENLSLEQKTQLGSVVDQLQGQFGNLNVKMDETGKVYIENSPLIQDSIGYLNQEGVTVDTLSQIRINEARTHASCQVGDTQITYSQVIQRIQYYKQEIAGIQQLMQAQFALAQGNGEIVGQGETNYDVNDTEQNDAVEHRIRANAQARWNAMNNELSGLQDKKAEIDKAYNAITLPNAPSGGSSSVGGDYMPSGGSGKKGKEVKDYTEDIADLKSELKIDELEHFNDAIKDLDNQLTSNKTLRGQLTEGSPEYQASQKAEIELLKQKQKATQDLIEAEKKQAETKKAELEQLGFSFDANGKLINQNEKLIELQNQVNSMGGSTEEDKKAKQKAIEQLKDINDKVKEYGTLIEDTIPKSINEYNELANTAKEVADAMKKANEESLNNLQEQLAQNILKDAKEQVDELKAQAEQAREDAKQALEDEKESELAIWDEKIKSKEEELKRLDEQSSDNETKLKKLQEELALWQKETNNPFAKSKVQGLTTQISDLQKTIAKDNLQKDIDSLNEQKDNASKYYDNQLTELEKANKAQEIEDQKHYDDMLNEKQAYNKAEKMIEKNKQNEMYALLSKYSESYKTMGTNLAESIDASLKKITDGINAFNSLKIKTVGEMIGNDNNSSDVYVAKDSGGIPEADTAEQKSHASNSSSSSNNSNANKQYANGDYTDSNGNYYTNSGDSYYDAASGKYKKYASGTDNAQAGYAEVAEDGFEILIGRQTKKLKGGETILNNSTSKNLIKALGENSNNETSQINDIYNFVKSSGGLINQLAQSYSNMGNYSMPNLGVNDLNKIANSIINNDNSSNNISTPIEMSVSIINQNGAEAVMNEKTLEKMVTKVVQKNATKYGGKGFTNR